MSDGNEEEKTDLRGMDKLINWTSAKYDDQADSTVSVNWNSLNTNIGTINAAGTATDVSTGVLITITATSTQMPP